LILNDAHAHPWMGGVEQLKNVACDKISIDAILTALRARAAETPPGHWVRGFLYDDGKRPRPLTRADLDAAVPDHPVIVTHRGGHTAYANSLALAQAGITAATLDPPGGRFDHGADGQLNGRVADKAMQALLDKIPDELTRDDHRRGIALISKLYASYGVTSACEADATPDGLQGYQDARESGELLYRAYCLMGVDYLDRYIAAGRHTGFGDSMVRIGGIKQYADGSISERTAWLADPYVGIANYFGVESGTRESLYENSRKAWLAGFQLATHANGERAIDRMLGVYEQLLHEAPRRDPRFRLEHCTVVTPGLIARMRAVGAIPVPFAGYVNFHGDVMHFYGDERTQRMFAYRSLIGGVAPADRLGLHGESTIAHALVILHDDAPGSDRPRLGRNPTHHPTRGGTIRDPRRRVRLIRRARQGLDRTRETGGFRGSQRRSIRSTPRALAGHQGRTDDARRALGI
jgi:predicted amidohydrolase YtcJ